MNSYNNATIAPKLPPQSFTGLQLSNALENHYNNIRAHANKLKLQIKKLSNPSLIRNSALNCLTFKQYSNLHDHQKALKDNPAEQARCRQLIKEIETKYTTPPHIAELCREVKLLESNFNFLIDINKSTLTVLKKKAEITLSEKRKLAGREQDIFTPSTDKIAELHKDSQYQNQLSNKPQKTKSL